MKEVSFEWLNPKILSWDSKVVQLKYKSAPNFGILAFLYSQVCYKAANEIPF